MRTVDGRRYRAGIILSNADPTRTFLGMVGESHLPAEFADGVKRIKVKGSVVKVLLAGADVAMMTSALLLHGPEHLRAVEAGLRDWLEEHGMQSVGHVRGLRSQRSIRDPAAWERANYITMLSGYLDQADTQAR